MDLVVDANVLFAALIKDSTTSALMLHEDIHLYAPEFLLMEFEKYKDLILRKTNRNESEFDTALQVFQRRIKLIPSEEIKRYVKDAKAISPDKKDVPYVALAMALHIAIWSNDKNLKKKQDEVDVYSTEDLLSVLSRCGLQDPEFLLRSWVYPKGGYNKTSVAVQEHSVLG